MTIDRRGMTATAGRLTCVAGTSVLALMMGACAQINSPINTGVNSITGSTSTARAELPPGQLPQSELEKATQYWGQAYAKDPHDKKAALSYARNLKAMGQKVQASNVLQQAQLTHPDDRELASESGRLAVEQDQFAIAGQMLQLADDPANPDWRVISARGTVLAKTGHASEAIPYFQRSLSLAPEQPSVLNNLALAYAMNGEPDKAEPLLRQAAAKGNTPRMRQNLALVLGLQGKYDEATRTAAQDLPAGTAAANTSLVRRIVQLDPKAAPKDAGPAIAVAAASAKAAAASATGTAPAVAGWEARVRTPRPSAPAQQTAATPADPALPALKPAAD